MVANQINDFLLNPHLIRGYTEVHKTASTPASASSSSTNYVTEGSTAKVGATNNFAMSGISRPVSVKPVVDTSFANLPSFQPSASSPSPTQSRSEFRPKDSSGSFQPSPTAGASKGMTGRNRRRQLIMECRRLRSDIGKFEDEFSAINQRAPKVLDARIFVIASSDIKILVSLIHIILVPVVNYSPRSAGQCRRLMRSIRT